MSNWHRPNSLNNYKINYLKITTVWEIIGMDMVKI